MTQGRDPILSFAVITDTHLEPERRPDGSPLPEIPRVNRRARRLARTLNRIAPAFVVHLGDVVHPIPSLSGRDPAVAAARAIFAGIEADLYWTAGNHDIGDKPEWWMPCKPVSAEAIAMFERDFGPSRCAFTRGDCHFVLFNSPVLNAGLAFEHEQRAWLEAELERHREKRLFLLTHYPPYLLEREEESHYDNIAEPTRSWLLDLLETSRVEALFTGHVHNVFYNRHGRTDCYVLPTLSFVRAEYAELFRVEPEDGSGRDDPDKIGFFLVDVYEDGHEVTVCRAGDDEEGEEDGEDWSARLPRVRIRDLAPAPVGVHLRHPWCEVTELPHNPPMEEFLRRRARNDYPVRAFWDLGIRRLRVPAADLREPASRARMQALVDRGHAFTLFSAGVPDPGLEALFAEHARLLSAWEVVVPESDVPAGAAAVRRVKLTAGLRTFLGCFDGSADDPTDAQDSTHYRGSGPNLKRYFAGSGLTLRHADALAALAADPAVREAFDGLILRLEHGEDPWSGIGAARDLARAHGFEAVVTVTLAPATQRAANRDDDANARAVARAVFAAHVLGDVGVFLDTFMDIDRGFYVRTGLVDRRYTPRPAGRVLGHLQAALAGMPAGGEPSTVRLEDGGEACLAALPDALSALIDAGCSVAHLPAPAGLADGGTARVVDLIRGRVERSTWRRAGDGRLELARPLVCERPTLVVLGA